MAVLLILAGGLHALGFRVIARGSAAPPNASSAAQPGSTTVAEPSASAGNIATLPSSHSASALDAALPPTRFTWPDAGINVDVVAMTWSADKPINPPLDANGFDPVAHWLTGTGLSEDQRPIVLAAHTCQLGTRWCRDEAFPFNRLSFEGWAVGQRASLAGADGISIGCALEERRIVDKSREFEFPNDPCLVVAFSCNALDPGRSITLVTFRCGKCI